MARSAQLTLKNETLWDSRQACPSKKPTPKCRNSSNNVTKGLHWKKCLILCVTEKFHCRSQQFDGKRPSKELDKPSGMTNQEYVQFYYWPMPGDLQLRYYPDRGLL